MMLPAISLSEYFEQDDLVIDPKNNHLGLSYSNQFILLELFFKNQTNPCSSLLPLTFNEKLARRQCIQYTSGL
jgi:hypothetical protein